MKWVWVHSMRFQPRGHEVYSEAQITHQIWQRYLLHVDELVVVGRRPESSGSVLEKYRTPCHGNGVRFELMEGINQPVELLQNTFRVSRCLREVIADAHGVIARLPSEHGLAAIGVARQMKKPVAIELVGCPFDALWNNGPAIGKFYAPLLAARVRRAVRACNFVLYVTETFLQQRYPSFGVQTHVSNVSLPSLDHTTLQTSTAIGVSLADEPASSQRLAFNIGLIGSFQNESKGHKTALLALRELLRKGVRCRLHLVGVGDYERWRRVASELGVAEAVEFVGVVAPGAPILEWLSGMDIYVQPSFAEGLPRALIEAMAAERSAVGSTAAGIPELLPEECLHKPGDWRQLAKKLEFAAHNANWRRDQGKLNRQRAREFAPDVLDRRRSEFWSAFAQHCETEAKSGFTSK